MKAFNSMRTWFAFIALLVLGTPQVRAAYHVISIDAFGFSPASLTISRGDTVEWDNNDDMDLHETTSDLGLFNPDYWSAILDFGEYYAKVFNNPGKFTYHDSLGGGTGTINMSAPVTINLVESRIEDGHYLFDATGLTSGKSYTLLTSTNLTDWTSVSTNAASAASMTFTNAINSGFTCYRLLQQP